MMFRDNKVKTLVCSALCAVAMSAEAQSTLPSPYSSVDGGVVVSSFFTMDAPSTPKGIFINAMLWAADHMPDAEEGAPGPVPCDIDAMQLSIDCVVASKKFGGQYSFRLTVRVADNILTTLASDISHEAAMDVVKITKRSKFDKFQPDKKPKQKEYMDDFAALYEALLNDMTAYVASHDVPAVTHWTQIEQHDVTKDMTEDECILALGRPVRKQEQTSKVQWIYDSFTFLYFDGGKLFSFVK